MWRRCVRSAAVTQSVGTREFPENLRRFGLLRTQAMTREDAVQRINFVCFVAVHVCELETYIYIYVCIYNRETNIRAGPHAAATRMCWEPRKERSKCLGFFKKKI